MPDVTLKTTLAVEVVSRQLSVRGLPPALAGRTLAQISDVHVGPRVDDAYVLSVFTRVATLRPDIVVLTGDLVSHHKRVFEQMERIYHHFPKGRIATVGIPGNHDYGPAWSHPEIADRVVAIAQQSGIVMLRNGVHEVEGLQIVGLDDLWAKRFEPAAAFSGYDDRRPAIALSHNPDTVDAPVWERYEGWVLSGHTHGGQCKAPFLPPPLLPVRNRRYTQGRVPLERQPVDVHLSRRRSLVACPAQRPTRGDAVRASPGVTASAGRFGSGC